MKIIILKDNMDQIKVGWKKGDVIRNKQDGHPLLVLHIYKNVCTVVVDLEDHKALPVTYALLPKEYYRYAIDSDMKYKESDSDEEGEDDTSGWEFDPIDLEERNYNQQTL